MCIILAGVTDTLPTRDELEYACAYNPDGFGYAINVGGTVKVEWSLDSNTIIELFLAMFKNARQTGTPVHSWAFHARIATHGNVCLDNCHPFVVDQSLGEVYEYTFGGEVASRYTETTSSVMFHNGVLNVAQHKDDPRTDSETFLRDYLPELGGIPRTWRATDVIGAFAHNSKLVFVHADADDPLTIVNEDLGHWKRDVWRSNYTYEPYTSGYTGGSWSKSTTSTTLVVPDGTHDYDLCNNPDCRNFMARYADFCEICGWCQWCDELWDKCNCPTTTTFVEEAEDEILTEYDIFRYLD